MDDMGLYTKNISISKAMSVRKGVIFFQTKDMSNAEGISFAAASTYQKAPP